MSRWKTHVIDVAADTDVQVAGGTAGDVSTRARMTTLKFAFQFTSTPGVVAVAPDEDTSFAGDGFPIFPDTDTLQASSEDLKLTSDDEVWVRATEAGTLYVWNTGA